MVKVWRKDGQSSMILQKIWLTRFNEQIVERKTMGHVSRCWRHHHWCDRTSYESESRGVYDWKVYVR